MRAVMLQNNLRHYNPTFSCCRKPSYQFRQKPLKGYDITVNRRVGALAALSLTIEEAESGIIGHAQALLQVKHLIESESWGQLQTAVRKGSPLLKQDIYTIIQQKPGNERPLLRKLYSNLFNYVTRLDYAARDRDASRIRECYENMVLVLNEVISRL
ncbi:psbQ-like protein 3, chloroplastic [Argentina anserina]|uniref:psbQ-like protein 3, chloroplastic n=1 Tax=Argentina anserina TaxID=57926 RepID=UPI0021769127|nr:psbQ-like protein 3, chloroplastic [Potentilla anserina]